MIIEEITFKKHITIFKRLACTNFNFIDVSVNLNIRPQVQNMRII